MSDDAAEYAKLYTDCVEWIQEYTKSAFGKKIAPFLKKADDAYATVLKNVPGDFDKLYQNDSQFYISADTQIEKIKPYETLSIESFDEGIDRIRLLYNDSAVMYIDSKNIYLLKDAESKEV